MLKRKGTWKKAVALILTGAMLFGDGTAVSSFGVGMGVTEVSAAETTTIITSMEYYNDANGAEYNRSGVTDSTFGFVLPKFNGKPSQELDLSMVEKDLQLLVWQQNGTNGEWKNINDVSYFKFNGTWAWEHQTWSETADGWVAWFKVQETTKIRFHSIQNNVNLDYTLNFTKLPEIELTSISAKEGEKTAGATGGSGIDKTDFIYNGNESITYDQVAKNIDILVKRENETEFVPLFDNAKAGWIYDQNFGVYTEGNGGWWFNTEETFTVRFQSKQNPAMYAETKIIWNEPDRSNGTLTSYDGTTTYNAITSSHAASVGISLPKINGTNAVKSDLEKFVYQVCVGAVYNSDTKQWSGGEWVNMSDVSKSGWVYQGNGYNEYSSKFQWGYWVDGIYGLWFQPVKYDTYIRIGYPENGQAGGAINENYVYYTLIGDPDAKIPDDSDMGDIVVDSSNEDPTGDVSEAEANAATPDGWKLIWHDEFNGNTVNTANWTNQTGFLLDENDYTTAGWGNNELEWYTDSDKNTSVKNGALNFTMLNEPKTFYDTNGNEAKALYSSGKLISKDKFSVKYGRVDFRAKLPDGVGIWPALWMMPNDDVYGTWACSGEIDIMEGRGRTPELAFGTLHYGGQWPGNKSTGDTLDMVEEGNVKSDMNNWHVYSLVWEEGNIKIYADGKCYFKCTNSKFFSNGSNGNINAPFDQRFYLIMNLAAGGWFDDGYVPDSDFQQADMYVDYVRVYQKAVEEGEDEKNDEASWNSDGTNDGLYGDYKIGQKGSGGSTGPGGGIVESGGTGNTGDNGNTGNTGDGGSTGDNGNTGNGGNTGDTGNTGDGGNTGDTGNGGNTGDNGNTGNTGNGGSTGDNGNTGNTGNGGNTGDNGNTGNTGNGGNTGDTGNTGNGGNTGDTGNTEETAPVAVSSIKLTGISKKIAVGKKIQLTADVAPFNASNKSLKWSTSNKKYATVSPTGLVSVKKAGKNKTVTITATATDGSGKKATYKIKIMPNAVKKIALKASAKTVKAGKTVKIKATVTPNLSAKKINKTLKWSSSNTKYATVTAKGVVKTKKAGKGKTVKITAMATDGSNKKQTVKIKIK